MIDSTKRNTQSIKHFEGDYVTADYMRRSDGYDWIAVRVKAINDTLANVKVQSRIDIKKPTCTFESNMTLTNGGDSLITNFKEHIIYLTINNHKLSFSSDNNNILRYFCSGGGSLTVEFIKLDNNLDTTQLEN